MKNIRIITAIVGFATAILLSAAPAQAVVYTYGTVQNLSSSSADIRAWSATSSTATSGTSLCAGTFRYVAPGASTPSSFDAGCVAMQDGPVKVTGNVKVLAPNGSVLRTYNVGCSTGRTQIRVLNGEKAQISSARLCVA